MASLNGAHPQSDSSNTESPARLAEADTVDAAIRFLRRFHPSTHWALVTLGPGDDETGPARTFDPTEEEAARRFIESQQGKRNIYFAVNCVDAKLTKKAKKKDIAEVHWLHVDADLNKALNWSDPDAVAAERARVLAQLRDYSPPPTAIVWSGGGYQGFWRLSEVIVVNGNKTLMAPIERRILHIEEAFSADACHNVDRVMRVPGTLNVLGRTKLRAGRTPALAELVEFHDDRIYDLEDFPEADAPHSGANGPGAQGRGDQAETVDRVRHALATIPADDYEVYLKVGMALKSEFGDGGFSLYRDWAVRSVKFDDAENRRKWASITPEGGVTIATLFALARDHGWREELRAVPGRARRGATREARKDSPPMYAPRCLADESPAAPTAADGPDCKAWPILGSAATYGLIGDVVKIATSNSEVDPIAVMATLLTWGGAYFGRNPFMKVADSDHHARLFCALVGASSRARKGTSVDPVRRIFRAAERALHACSTLSFPSGCTLKVSKGPLSSGEGLLDAIRDKRDDQDQGGVDDKRLLCIEGELGAVLRACQRQGNNLSTTLRVAWDGWDLAPLTKHDKVSASDPHICIIGHITRHELSALLSATDVWNGFANRFLWLAVRRAKAVPLPQPMPDTDVERLGSELARVIGLAHSRTGGDAQLTMSNSAQSYWCDIYGELTQEHGGILGAVTSRGEAQALRLAMTFALFDGAVRVEQKHVEAGLAFWRYAFDSANFIFSGAELDPMAQKIVEALSAGPKSQTDIVNLFGRHESKARIHDVLATLQERGRVTMTKHGTSGRPRSVWSIAL
jgi:Primase C terminal 2 (PriCT-2)